MTNTDQQQPSTMPITSLSDRARGIVSAMWEPRAGDVRETVLYPDGAGVILIRSARPEVGQPINGLVRQLESVMESLDRLNLTPRTVICSIGVGTGDLAERPDLLRVLGYAAQPWCEFIAVATSDRLTRSEQVNEATLKMLSGLDVSVIVADASDPALPVVSSGDY